MSAAAVHSLVYCSRSGIIGPEIVLQAQLLRIMASAGRHNARLGVRGVLMLDEGWFTQLLEGPVDGVEALFARIGRDRRHVEVTLLENAPIPQHRLPEWSMAFLGGSPAVGRLFVGCRTAAQLDRRVVTAARLVAAAHELVRATTSPAIIA